MEFPWDFFLDISVYRARVHVYPQSNLSLTRPSWNKVQFCTIRFQYRLCHKISIPFMLLLRLWELWLIKDVSSLSACVVCWSPLQTVWTKIGPDILSGPILIQTVWHFNGISEMIVFDKVDFETNQQATKSIHKWSSMHRVGLVKYSLFRIYCTISIPLYS